MKTKVAFLLFSAVAVTACDQPGPTSPTAVLSVSQTSLSLTRTATAQLSATSSLSGTTNDVTATATWRSSNALVATVSAGLVTAVGPGTATVTVEQGGQSQTVSVTVRRRVFLRGSLQITDTTGNRSIESVTVYVNNELAGGIGTSSPASRVTARFGTASTRILLAPGAHTISFQLRNVPGDYSLEFVDPPTVMDFDTDEAVATVNMANRQGRLDANAIVDWAVTIGTYTS